MVFFCMKGIQDCLIFLEIFHCCLDWRDVSQGLDRVRSRYGDEALFLGREWAALRDKQAPDRIGFRKIEGPGYDTDE